MRTFCILLAMLVSTVLPPASADIIIDYTQDAGGDNPNPLNGLSARGTFSIAGTHLTVLLENTSSGVPAGFDSASSLLVSLGFNLLDADILSGNSAVIGPGAVGIGDWSGRIAGDSVAEQWVWTNDFGGDLMESWKQVISTSDGQGGGTIYRFDGGSGGVNGPFGGIAADPPLVSIPANKPAVSNAILFDLTLTAPLTEAQLAAVAHDSIVEYGSDQKYLTTTPEPGALALLAAAGLLWRRR